MNTRADAGTCRLCENTLIAHYSPGGTSYRDRNGSRVCPDADDPLFMAHQPWPSKPDQQRRAA